MTGGVEVRLTEVRTPDCLEGIDVFRLELQAELESLHRFSVLAKLGERDPDIRECPGIVRLFDQNILEQAYGSLEVAVLYPCLCVL